MSPQQQLANKIYEILPHKKDIPKDLPLPVRYDGMAYYWGINGEMVADFDDGVNTGDGFRIRGWGRIQDSESQDECARYIEKAINSYSTLRLADLLLAIRETEHRSCVGVNFDSDGAYVYYDDMENASGAKYNLSNDNILSQSDELCEFCLGLLEIKK